MISKETVLRIIDEDLKNAESALKSGMTTVFENARLYCELEVLRRLKVKVNNISEHSTEKGKDSSIDPDDRYYEKPGQWKSHGYVDRNGWTHG